MVSADNKPLSEEVLNANLVYNGDIFKVHYCVCAYIIQMKFVPNHGLHVTPLSSMLCGLSAYLLLTDTMFCSYCLEQKSLLTVKS